jgi:hypothetical protein
MEIVKLSSRHHLKLSITSKPFLEGYESMDIRLEETAKASPFV